MIDLVLPPRLRSVTPVGRERDLLQYFHMCGVWSLSTYTACDLRCSYCVSYAQGRSEPRQPVDQVVAKLRDELARIPADAVIGVGSLIDCYPHSEAEHGVTRVAIEELVAQGRRLVIVTKGTTIERDIDLLADRDHISVLVSLSSLDDDGLRRVEPNVAPASERLALIRRLADAGVRVEMHVQPWIPGLTDAEAMIELMAGEVPICFGPLNVQMPTMAGTALARDLAQPEINAAYLAEFERIGQRPGVVWQQPVWLGWEHAAGGGAEVDAFPVDPGPTDRIEERNAAIVQRLVRAFDDGSVPMIVLEVLSPHVVGHDLTGLLSDLDHPDSGQFVDVLGAAAVALGDARVDLRSIVAHQDEVDVRVAISGVTVEPFLGHAAGASIAVEADLTYRLDTNGLIVELWQHALAGCGRP